MAGLCPVSRSVQLRQTVRSRVNIHSFTPNLQRFLGGQEIAVLGLLAPCNTTHWNFSHCAVKLVYEHRLYVSAMKLLVSFIGSAAHIERGDVRGNFASWPSKFANLTPVGIIPDELWEFRNALLHMTSNKCWRNDGWQTWTVERCGFN